MVAGIGDSGPFLASIFKIVVHDDDDVYFPLTHYYLQDTNQSNYLQLLSIMKS